MHAACMPRPERGRNSGKSLEREDSEHPGLLDVYSSTENSRRNTTTPDRSSCAPDETRSSLVDTALCADEAPAETSWRTHYLD